MPGYNVFVGGTFRISAGVIKMFNETEDFIEWDEHQPDRLDQTIHQRLRAKPHQRRSSSATMRKLVSILSVFLPILILFARQLA
jgi:hypothetical protein